MTPPFDQRGAVEVEDPGACGEAQRSYSWDLDLADARDGVALGHVERQQPERVLFAHGVDRPPDLVSTKAARGQRRPMAKGALVSFERGEHDTAVVLGVMVVEEVSGHRTSLSRAGCGHIGASP